MIIYDGIIFSLQKMGGISVLFQEILSRLPTEAYRLGLYPGFSYKVHEDQNIDFLVERVGERYRKSQMYVSGCVFHSTYYRLPVDRRGPVVTTVHDFTYERFSKGIKKYVHSSQKSASIKGADRIICVSNSTKEDLLYYLGDRYDSKVQVVHNGVSPAYFNIPSITYKKQVIYVGARNGYKNFMSLVHSLEGLDEITLLCVGGGEFSDDELRELNKNISGRYSHVGYLSDEALNYEYNRSLCLVYPSLYEGFGIPVLEAMRAGCPVIAVNKTSIPEVAGSSAMLLDQGSPDEIRDAITRLFVPSTRESYVSKGYVQSNKFSWDITYEKTVEVYRDLVGDDLFPGFI